jgi:hypothetical protein
MADKITSRPFEKTKTPKQLKRDWNLTLLAMILTTLILFSAAGAALLFGALSPYTTAPAVGP